MKTDLITRSPKRFFAFGCSFTNYHWATWANIIGEDLKVKYNTEFYNCGRIGIGNEAIMNIVSQADSFHKFTEDDLVMICWTNVARIDVFTNSWMMRGNLFSSDDWRQLRRVSINELLLKNIGYIHTTNGLLEGRGCQFHGMQMCQIDGVWDQMDVRKRSHVPNIDDIRSIFKETFASLQPSYYDALWEGNLNPRLNWFDPHPSPVEHHEYLKKIYLHNWESEVLDKIVIADDRIDNQVQAMRKTGVFNHKQLLEFFTRGKGHKTNEEIIMQLLINEGNDVSHLLINER